jgi:hypothetical protein
MKIEVQRCGTLECICCDLNLKIYRYATSRKVAGSRHDEVSEFLIHLILPAAPGPGVYSASNRNEYQKKMCLGSRARPVRKFDLTAISERLSRESGILNMSQPYRPPRPVTAIALLFGACGSVVV